MGQQKGGKKLRRTAKHKGKYDAQFNRTARNKAAAAARVARRRAKWAAAYRLEQEAQKATEERTTQ